MQRNHLGNRIDIYPPFTTWPTEAEARSIADAIREDDYEWRYEVVMTPSCRYVVVVIDENDETLGFL